MLLSFAFLFLTVSFSTVQAAGEIDPTFNGGVVDQPNRHVYALKRQADGKILVGGDFETSNGNLSNSIARQNSDSTPDTTFNPPDLIGTIRAIEIQSDGKILIGGNFVIPLLTNNTIIARLNVDGTFDYSFVAPTLPQADSSKTVNDIAVSGDGKILIAGSFSYNPPSGAAKSKFARLNADGTTDTTFNPTGIFTNINDIELQPDGKIIGITTDGGSGSRFIKRFNADGTEDFSFNTLISGSVNALKLLPDGKILVGGDFGFVNNIARVNAARLNADGTLDTTFNITSNGVVNDIDTDISGGILIGGTFNTFNGTARRYIVRVDVAGILDPNFANALPTAQFVNSILPLPDGKIVLSAASLDLSNSGDTVLGLNVNGAINNSFAVKVGVRGIVRKIVVQPDGKILVAGDFGAINSFSRKEFARFNADGSADTTFNPSYDSFNFPVVTAIALQADGKILVGGADPYSTPLKRLNTDGSFDSTFVSRFFVILTNKGYCRAAGREDYCCRQK